jgi:oligoendopeptidase F
MIKSKVLVVVTILLSSIANNYSVAQELTSGLLERNQIDEKYRWDLSDIYESVEVWEKDYDWIKQNLSQYENYKGKLSGSATTLLQCLKFNDTLDNKLNWVRMYPSLNRDVDMNSEKYQNMWSRYTSLEAEVNVARSFINSEIISIPEETIRNFIAENEGLKIYEHFLNKLLLKQKHTLPPEQEKILAKASKLIDNPYSVFGKLIYAELPFPTIKNDNGEDVFLNRSISWRARSSPDRVYRKRGYEEYYGALKNYKGTLAQNLSNYIDGNIFNAEVRGYNSALDASFAQFNLPVKVYDNLIETVRANLESLQRWMKLKKQILKYDTLYLYDTMVSLFSETEKEYSWEEARDLLFESLGQMGDNYVGDIQEAYDKRWVDAFPNIGKETGGYSSGPHGPHPYVKMNWGGKGLDYTTLVHEFGHFVHAYKTMRKQPYVYYSYPSFLSEIASTTAENISWAYLIDNAKTESEKLYLIGQFVDLIVLYFYTSAMNAEFEKILYQTVEEGGSLSAESMSKVYKDLTKAYYGEALTLTEYDSYVWAEWPHFYFGYYIYSYATSFAAAIQISENIRSKREPAVNRFIQFLEAGSSDYPVNVIKKAGVDLTSPEPIIAVVKRMNELIDQIEDILIKNNLD